MSNNQHGACRHNTCSCNRGISSFFNNNQLHCSCGHPIADHQQLNYNTNTSLSNSHLGISPNNNNINSNTFINERSVHPFYSDSNNPSFSTPPPLHVQITRTPTASEYNSFLHCVSQPSPFESHGTFSALNNVRMGNQLCAPNNVPNVFNNNHASTIAQLTTNSF